ncbi:hypothetical protein BJX76DRAFT_347671 [Aspergillus varians]
MELAALDLFARPARIQWTSEMKIFICCLIKYFEKENSVFQDIFNSRFKKELEECGFGIGNPVKWSTLNTQWVTLRRYGDPIWGDVHLSSFDSDAWFPVITIIEETAAFIDVPIVRKTHDSVDTSCFTYRSPEPYPQRELAKTLQDEQPSLEETITTSTDPYLCTAGGKVCFWCNAEGLDQKPAHDLAQIHPLLYRWWNVESQGVNSKCMFTAGLFSDTARMHFSPDTISKEEFYGLFERHIRRCHVPSPFISTFKSALAPVHRGLREQEGASISIIDTKKLVSKVYSAKEFVQKHKVKIGTYSGAGEYLIWGQVNTDAIACTFKVTTLCRIAEEYADIGKLLQLDRISRANKNRKRLHEAMAKNAVYLDKKAGATVGRLLSLLEVPYEHCRTVSEGIAYSWRVKTRRLPWRDFFEGVDIGYRGLPVIMLTPAHSPVRYVGADADDDAASDSDVYSLSEDSSDNEMLNNPSPDDEDNETLPNDTPTTGALRTPLLEFESPLVSQHMDSNLTIALIDSSDEEMDDAGDLHPSTT